MNLKEILARQKEIRTQLESDTAFDAATMDGFEVELKELDASKAAIEKRQTMINGINVGTLPAEHRDGIVATASAAPVDYATMDAEELRSLPEYRNAFLKVLQGKDLNESEKRVLTTTSGATAAVPTETLNMVIDKLRQTSVLFSKIDVMYIAGNISFTVANAKNDAAWKTEGNDGAPADDTVVAVTLAGYELIKLVEISAAAMVMTIPAFEQYIVAEIGRKMSIAIENAILNGAGSGSNEPTGIFTGVSFDGDNSVQYTTLTYDKVVDLTVLLPTMYHMGAEFVASRTFMMGSIRKVKDANGLPIFAPSVVAGQPSTILGYPVTIDDYMPDDTTLLFGDLKYYKMNFAKAIELKSDTSIGFKSGKVTYRGLAVADGKPVLDEAFCKLYK